MDSLDEKFAQSGQLRLENNFVACTDRTSPRSPWLARAVRFAGLARGHAGDNMRGPGLLSFPDNPFTEHGGERSTTVRGARRMRSLNPPPPPRGAKTQEHYRPRDFLTQLTAISLVHACPDERAYKHAIGGVSTSYAGHVPGAREHYGSSHKGGLPFREPRESRGPRPLGGHYYGAPLRPPPMQHATSSTDYGRQAWLDGRSMPWATHVTGIPQMFDGRAAPYTRRAPVRI